MARKWSRAIEVVVVYSMAACSPSAPAAVAPSSPAAIGPSSAALGAGAAVAPSASAASSPGATPLPADAEVRRILAERVGELGDHHGIVVGLLDARGRRIVSQGHFGKDNARALDGDTLFELGSISKVFTSLLLVLAAERGEVGLDDPLAKHLPAGTAVPAFEGREITLRHLATHTSGLPRLPTNLKANDINDPYADYTVENLYEFLGSYALARAPGTQYEYSNLGAALLARALIVRTGKTYAELVQDRITEPLGLRHTWVDVPDAEKASLALGHTQALYEAPLRTRIAMIGNGGVFSTPNDLLTFLSAGMGLVKTPLAAAFAQLATPQRPLDKGGSVGLGWHIAPANGADVVWHNGGTAGFSTFAAYIRDQGVAVVALSNVSTSGGVDDIAMHLIAQAPLLPAGSPDVTPSRPRQQVAIDSRRLDGYVGAYQLAPGRLIRVIREGDQLIAELSGKKFPIFPESATTFFMKVLDMTFRFEADDSGKVVAVMIGQGSGKENRVPRAQEESAGNTGSKRKVAPLEPSGNGG